MTIKDIAEAAGVSISTVSKVINKKDESISPETRRRIMQVVKEYHYTPYGEVLANKSQRSFMLGIVYDEDGGNDLVLAPLGRAASQHHYSVVVTMGKTPEEENRSFQVLASQNVDGIIWYPVKGSHFDSQEYTKKHGIPVLSMDFRRRCDADNICFDFYELGYQMTSTMIDRGHERILCLLHIPGSRAMLLSQGYRQCMQDHGLTVDDSFIYVWKDYSSEPDLNLADYTAVVCYDMFLARKLAELAERADLSVPEDLSVATVGNGDRWMSYENISSLARPPQELARFIVNKLVDMIEGIPNDEVFVHCFDYNHQRSIDVPKNLREKCLMTIGPVAMETVLQVPEHADGGTKHYAKSQEDVIGGGGFKQVLAAKDLGVTCYPVWRIGNDVAGRKIYRALKSEQVNMECVTMDSLVETPQIYTIYTGMHKERIFYGTSEMQNILSDMEEKRNVLRRCHFCLVQNGTDINKLGELIKLAHKYEVKVIVKAGVGTQQELASLSDYGADIMILAENGNKGNEDLLTCLCQSNDKLVIALSDSACRFLYRGSFRELCWNGEFTDMDASADIFSAALACYLPVQDGTEEMVETAVTKAFDYMIRRVKL